MHDSFTVPTQTSKPPGISTENPLPVSAEILKRHVDISLQDAVDIGLNDALVVGKPITTFGSSGTAGENSAFAEDVNGPLVSNEIEHKAEVSRTPRRLNQPIREGLFFEPPSVTRSPKVTETTSTELVTTPTSTPTTERSTTLETTTEVTESTTESTTSTTTSTTTTTEVPTTIAETQVDLTETHEEEPTESLRTSREVSPALSSLSHFADIGLPHHLDGQIDSEVDRDSRKIEESKDVPNAQNFFAETENKQQPEATETEAEKVSDEL